MFSFLVPTRPSNIGPFSCVGLADFGALADPLVTMENQIQSPAG